MNESNHNSIVLLVQNKSAVQKPVVEKTDQMADHHQPIHQEDSEDDSQGSGEEHDLSESDFSEVRDDVPLLVTKPSRSASLVQEVWSQGDRQQKSGGKKLSLLSLLKKTDPKNPQNHKSSLCSRIF